MKDPFADQERSRTFARKPRSSQRGFLRALELDIVEHLEFFQSFMREPASVGALSPSSRALARAMIEGFSLKQAELIVELGAGTGAFTGPILERIGKHTSFVAMELDPIHARNLKRRFPGVTVYNDSAERISDYLGVRLRQRADYIVSGLPWANIPCQTQQRIMEEVLSCLAPNGVFTTFAYLHARWMPKARRFRHALEERFVQVNTSPVIWGNLPPAFVYRCTQLRG